MNLKKYISGTDTAIAGGLFEINSRFGDAGAEFLKGLRGVDNQTGQIFDRSLSKVANYKLNPQDIERNIKQQAGFSAEVASVSKKNAEAIINKSPSRFSRSEDIAHYGKNHNTVDIVEQVDGVEVSTSQMKFVSKPDELLKKIAKGDGFGGKNDLSRYLDVDKLELPTEQVEKARQICQEQAASLRQQAQHLLKQGQTELAQQKLNQADKYDTLQTKISDSGISTEEARHYRLNPVKETIKDIAHTSHRAGLEGAKLGAAIGGSISLITNMLAVKSGDKEFSEALMDTTTGTLKAAGFGYATAFAGSATKTLLQQSQSQALRSISKTGLPGMIVSLCASTTKSIYSYTRGDIDEGQLMQDLGGITTGAIASSLFTVTGQALIPIPVLGGIIGSMVGCIVVNTFYDGFFQALNDAKLAKENRIMVEMRCEAARKLSQQYREHFEWLFDTKLSELQQEKQQLLHILNQEHINADDFCSGMNQFASFLGKKLTINSMTELDEAMLSDQPIVI